MKRYGVALGILIAFVAFGTIATIYNPPSGGGITVETDPVYLAAKDIDGTLAANSDAKVPSQKAVKTYVHTDALTSLLGTSVAAASTVNLDTATGSVVDITGPATIDSITLSAGTMRICRFTGFAILTHGSSLLLPGGVSLPTAVGDYAVFMGYPSGVVRCVLFQPVSGTAIQAGRQLFDGSGIPAVEGETRQLKSLDTSVALDWGTLGEVIITGAQLDGATKILGTSVDGSAPAAVDFYNRGLYGEDGTTLALSWDTGGVRAQTPLFLYSLPTSDPGDNGQIYEDPVTHVLKVSRP